MKKLDDLSKFGNLLSPSVLSVPTIADHTLNQAKWMHKRIVQSIKDFEDGLDQDHEVGARLVSFGPDAIFHVEDVGYWGPDMIVFHGSNNQGQKVQLLQHVSQLSVLLVAVVKSSEKARRIGFGLGEKIENDKK